MFERSQVPERVTFPKTRPDCARALGASSLRPLASCPPGCAPLVLWRELGAAAVLLRSAGPSLELRSFLCSPELLTR